MARSSQNIWLPPAFFLAERQTGKLISESLTVIINWCGGQRGWRLRYFQTDDSAAEQLGVRTAFSHLQGENRILHLLCTRHFVETMRRKIPPQYSEARACFQAAIYNRSSRETCFESLDRAKACVPEHLARWIERQKSSSEHWAHWGRRHMPLLLQASTTNPVEGWHSALKGQGEKSKMRLYTLLGTVQRVSLLLLNYKLNTKANNILGRGSRTVLY